MTLRPRHPAVLVVAGLLSASLLGGCGGLNRAVTTVPKTFDDLGAKTAPFRAGRTSEDEAGPSR
ncbi:hypothetical protein [Aurantimonas sp. 22II-16-19i]|uniref:hypothetical protein n=1 Tax=Aurantimonas sp. 22II-16-19i TaxID=1317114 RepID=UPI0009F7F15F|nr:hypothetical protein [Aurantimonas sp. 22II-16-19i]ORE97740.1 hypothetical protein ATO4_07370 [Aurantimonas sp. 22II-16-19i]